MAHPPYLIVRNGWYYFRLRIPKDLLAHFPRQELSKSLKTQAPGDAAVLAERYLTACRKIFALLRLGMLSREQILAIVEEEMQWILQVKEMTREANYDWMSEEQMKNMALNKQANCRKALVSRDYNQFRGEISALIEKKGLDIEPNTPAFNAFARQYIMGMVDTCEIELRRSEGDYNNPFDSQQKPDISNIRQPEPQPVQTTQAQQSSAYKLSDAIDLMMKEKGHSIGYKTTDEYGTNRDFVLDLVGDRPINEYSREDMLDARETLKKFPKRARQEPELKALSVKEIMSMEIPGPKLMERTYQKYLNFLTTVFNYCVEEALILDRSPCPKWKKSKELSKDEGWEAFEKDDLITFFTSPYYAKPATRFQSPEKFWIPLIAYLTGMRIDEICQLYKSDIRKKKGILCININDKLDKKLKNKPSKRIIPVPPELLELGFAKYVRSVKQERLWPNIKRGYNGYSHNYSKMIGKHIRRHVTKNKKKVFHSFRDTFAEEMLAAEVDSALFGGILGHAPAHAITAQYSGKHPVKVMLDAMRQVKHQIDIVALLQGERPKSEPKGKVITLLRKKATVKALRL